MNNLLLAIHYSRIFVGCFVFVLIHELLNKSINLSKVFKFVFTLFNLQGTVHFPLSRSAFAFYHTQDGLSRTFSSFFKVFSEVFSFRRCLAGNSDILPPPSPFVKHFFHIFDFILCLISPVLRSQFFVPQGFLIKTAAEDAPAAR